jgi:mannitol-specific phosphotransferase system IIBC component
VTSLIGLISPIETAAILFNMLVSVYDEAFKYTAFLVLAFVVTIVVNIYNWWYIKNKVLDENAQKEDKLSQKKVKVLLEEFKKQLARKEKYLKNKKKMDDKHGFGDDEQQFEGGKLEDGLDKLKRKLHITDEQFA